MSAKVATGVRLRGRRFVGRFLGRPWAWLWLLGCGVPFVLGWWLVAVPARTDVADQRSWFLWSGNILLALFIATMFFSLRKWSIKLVRFRDLGRRPRAAATAAWTEVQKLNRKALAGAYGSDEALVSDAQDVLAKHGVDKAQRVELRPLPLPDRTVNVVRIAKREPLGRLEPWLEMHMGVGTVACLAVWLHADFMLWHHVGWLLVVLSSLVLLTGLFGAFVYRTVPPKLSKADPGIPYEEAGIARESLHECLVGIVETLDETQQGLFQPLLKPVSGGAAISSRAEAVLKAAAAAGEELGDLPRDLVVMATPRDRLTVATAPARRLDLVLRVWKWVHIPVTALLFFVIAVHVLQVLRF